MIGKVLLELLSPIVVHNIVKKFTKDDSESKEHLQEYIKEFEEYTKQVEERTQILEKKVRALQIFLLTTSILEVLGFIIFGVLYFF